MSSIQIGNILRLDPRFVTDNAITVLKTRLRTPPSGFLVRCCLCGTERHHPTLIDPGQIVYDRFTCQTVNEMCSAAHKKPPLVRYSLVPGSLVLALHDPAHGRVWPAIIEDSPDDFPRHVATIHSEDNTSPTTAYFVTFINVRNWLGGWIRADSLLPFSSSFQTQVMSRAEGLRFVQAVRICNECLCLSLSERLLLLSFVVFAARQRGISLPDTRILKATICRQIMNRTAAEWGDDEMDWENGQSIF